MQWDRDPFKKEKYMIFDAIIDFARIHKEKNFNEITMKELSDFVDNRSQFHSYKEISKQMRINADIIIKEISDHYDKEIERLKHKVCKKCDIWLEVNCGYPLCGYCNNRPEKPSDSKKDVS